MGEHDDQRGGDAAALEALRRQNAELSARLAELRASRPDVAERERAAEALRQSEERYRLLSENVSDWLWTADLQLRFTYVSRSVERLRGYTVQEALAQSIDQILTPESLERAMSSLEAELVAEDADPPPPIKPFDVDLELTHKDGSTVWTEMKISFLRDADGAPTGICGIARDLTERRSAQLDREKLEAQLRHAQKMEAVGRLAGGIAHDFNNLLSVILGYTGFLREEAAEHEELVADIAEIEHAAERAANLTRQLLAFSRKQLWAPKALSLNAVVADTERMLRRIVGEDVALRTELAEDLTEIRADRGHLEQVLVNLAVNARDAMPQGGTLSMRTANVTLDAAEARGWLDLTAGQYVLMEVRDDGAGMPSEVVEHIFEPFFTTKKDGKGTGLGLSTVYGLVKQSGGHIAVESTLDQGSTFRIYFPQLAPNAKLSLAPPPTPSVAPSGKTVLLVEDEASLRNLIRRMLQRQGHRVIEAATANAALTLEQEHPQTIDVLLTDLVLPGQSGRELAEELCTRRPELRVVYMSGYPDETVAQHGMLADDIVFLPKPFRPQELGEKLHQVLKPRGQR